MQRIFILFDIAITFVAMVKLAKADVEGFTDGVTVSEADQDINQIV